LKIWRYVDLAKFVSMLATRTLCFPYATTELSDPYEGWMPRSHIKALILLNQTYLDQMKHTRDAIIAIHPARDRAPLDAVVEDVQRKLDLQQLLRETNAKFGVNCWHVNDGVLVLYDVGSSYFEGRCCPLAQHGHSRDHRGRSFAATIAFDLLTLRVGLGTGDAVGVDHKLAALDLLHMTVEFERADGTPWSRMWTTA
jgi:hypothetical protein